MARARSRIRGSKGFRRILRQMPDAMRDELVDVLRKAEPDARAVIAARVSGTTKRRTGKLIAGVKSKTFPRTLRMQAGFLGSKSARAKVFYARILDVGRKAQTVSAKRRGSGKTYPLRLGRIAPKRFVTGGFGDLRSIMSRQLRGVWERALRRISGGDA